MPLSPTPRPTGPARDRVLVVDKDPDTAASLGLLLELAGFDVRSAGDGETALSAAGEFRPHVVVTDVVLPRLDGIQVIDRLNALPPDDRPAVVVMTGWTDAAVRDRLVKARVEAAVIKPADPAGLTALLKEICAEKARACALRHESQDLVQRAQAATAELDQLIDRTRKQIEDIQNRNPPQV
jgi:DNA-binding response OmpR family regulator